MQHPWDATKTALSTVCIHGVYMAGKLYWRVKKEGKWTWKPAYVLGIIDGVTHVIPEMEEEE